MADDDLALSSTVETDQIDGVRAPWRCWLCDKPKGQGPDRCSGHYEGNISAATPGPRETENAHA
jgi:hypothetical protein